MGKAPFLIGLAGMLLAAAPIEPDIPDAVLSAEDVDAIASQSRAGAPSRSSTSERLFRVLRAGESGGTVDDLLEVVLTELEADCPAVDTYQIFNRSSSFISMKVKCTQRSTYMLTVGPVGLGVLSGGDGSIDRIRAGEGEVIAVNGTAPDERTAALATDPVGRRALAFAVGALLALIAVILFFIHLWSRRQQRVARWRSLKTEEKTALIEEAAEIEPGLYHHPDGIWIARGQRGKRRLFEWERLARLYRDRGIKFLQVR